MSACDACLRRAEVIGVLGLRITDEQATWLETGADR